MIVLNLIKIKSKFTNQLEIYKNIINYGSLECPCCHSKEYILWGFYERGVIYFDNDSIRFQNIKIQRIRCKSCHKTHALFPFGITPYKQLTNEVLIAILFNTSFDIFSEETIKYYHNQFNKYHYPNLVTMLQIRNKKEILEQLLKDKCKALEQYIKIFNKCFMQIKLGNLQYCSF